MTYDDGSFEHMSDLWPLKEDIELEALDEQDAHACPHGIPEGEPCPSCDTRATYCSFCGASLNELYLCSKDCTGEQEDRNNY